jgi:hypothetical protein
MKKIIILCGILLACEKPYSEKEKVGMRQDYVDRNVTSLRFVIYFKDSKT